MTQRLFGLLFALIAFCPLAATAELVNLSDAELDEVVYNSDIPVVIDCWAAWCGPCRAMGPQFEAAAEEFDGKVLFCKYDVDANSDLTFKHQIRGIPTLLFYKPQGDFDSKEVGYKDKKSIVKMVEEKLLSDS